MKKHHFLGKALFLLLAFCLVAATLVSCNKSTTLNTAWTSADTDAPTYFARILPMSDDAREKFTAASRGYNMSAEGFVDPEEAPDLGFVNLDGARAALELVKPSDDASIAKFTEFRDNLTEDEVKTTVEKMKTTVDLTPTSGIKMILVWIGKFLQLLTKMTAGYYVWALFIFALIVEILMLPFGIKQQKNSQKQAKLRPKELAIRKKYAGRTDQVSARKMQEEIQRLYQQEGFNPMGGCLPLLIQMPILIALYNLVVDPLQYVLGKGQGLSAALSSYCTTARAAGGLGVSLSKSRGTIELLSKVTDKLEGFANFGYFGNSAACAAELEGVTVPNFNFLGMNTGLIPGFHKPYILLLIPVLTFVFYFASMKLNRKLTFQPTANDPQMGCSNNMMDITMPLMSVYITFIVPAAVGIYWIFKSILSTGKQFALAKLMPLPTYTEEDIKAAERELKGKSKGDRSGAAERIAEGRVIRSLHHIDDDDDLPPRGAVIEDDEDDEAEEAAPEATEKAPENKMSAPLKQDRKTDKKK